MRLEAAEAMARELMAKHGLLEQDWTFRFDRAKRRFGQCSSRDKTISLSSALVELNAETDVNKTMLHEISHALAGPGHGHDSHWREIAISLGDDGRRCCGKHVVRPTIKRKQPLLTERWYKYCRFCGNNRYHYRKTRRAASTACGSCCGGKWNKHYVFKWRKVTARERKQLLAFERAQAAGAGA